MSWPAKPFRDRSMFDQHRWTVLEEVSQDIPAGDLVEIGSHKCGVAAALADIFPTRQVVAFDRFERGLSELGPKDMKVCASYHEGVQGSDYSDSLAFLKEWPNVRLVPGDVRETLVLEPDYPLALAIVDLNLYEPTIAAMRWAWDRLVPGGWLICDDPDFDGVRAALAEFGQKHQRRGGMAVLRKPS